jgi:hypothetical protein
MNTTQREASSSIKAVAYLFLFGGFSTLLSMVLSLFVGKINLSFGVLGIFIGFGLLRLEERWRIWAVVFTWFGLVITPILTALALANRSLPFQVFGIQVGQLGSGWGLVIGVVLFLFYVWQHAVLTAPDSRRLFHESGA